jgi:hypothetical protein
MAVFACAPRRAFPEEPRSRTALVEGRRAARSTASLMNEWDRGRPLDPSQATRAPLTHRAPSRPRPVASAASTAVGPSGRRGASSGLMRRTSAASLLEADTLAPLASSARRGPTYFARRASPATLSFEVRRSRVSLMYFVLRVYSRGLCCRARQMNELWQSEASPKLSYRATSAAPFYI